MCTAFNGWTEHMSIAAARAEGTSIAVEMLGLARRVASAIGT